MLEFFSELFRQMFRPETRRPAPGPSLEQVQQRRRAMRQSVDELVAPQMRQFIGEGAARLAGVGGRATLEAMNEGVEPRAIHPQVEYPEVIRTALNILDVHPGDIADPSPLLGGPRTASRLMKHLESVPGAQEALRALPTPPAASGETMVVRHYGPEAQQVDILDPARFGTGQRGMERARRDAFPEEFPARTFFYTPERMAGKGPEARFRGMPFVDVEIPTHDILPEDLWDQATVIAANTLTAEGSVATGARIANRTEQLLKDNGWNGYIRDGVLVRFGPTETPIGVANRAISEATARDIPGSTNGGATFTTEGEDLLFTPNYAVAVRVGDDMVVPAREGGHVASSDLQEFRNKFQNELREPENNVGTWRREATPEEVEEGLAGANGQVVVLDVARIFPKSDEGLEAALELGRANKQQAIFDLETVEEIPVARPEAPAILPSDLDRPLFDVSPEALERSFIEDVVQSPIQYERVAKGKRLERIRSRFTPARRRALIDLADQMRDQYPAAQFWYATRPLRERFIAELGEAEGIDAFNLFMRRVAATSPRTKVLKNIIFASRNRPVMSTQRGLLVRANTDEPFGLGAPKVSSFIENLLGNRRPTTADTHFTDVIGGPTPVVDLYGEYDRLFNKLAEEAGFPTADFQATIWPAGQTNYDPSPFLFQVDRAVTMAARRLGIRKEEALRRFLRGEEALGGMVVAALGAELAQNEEEER